MFKYLVEIYFSIDNTRKVIKAIFISHYVFMEPKTTDDGSKESLILVTNSHYHIL